MAYTPTKWQDHIEGVQDGTPVSAAALNNMEDGIAAAHGRIDDVTSSAIKPMPIYISTNLSSEGYIVFTCEGVTTGAYLFAAQGCYNPGGSGDYRSVYTAIIHVACGYNDNEVTAYIKMEPLLVSYGFTAADVDDTFKVGFERMDTSVRLANYNQKIYVQAQKSAGEPVNWTSSLQKLI